MGSLTASHQFAATDQFLVDSTSSTIGVGNLFPASPISSRHNCCAPSNCCARSCLSARSCPPAPAPASKETNLLALQRAISENDLDAARFVVQSIPAPVPSDLIRMAAPGSEMQKQLIVHFAPGQTWSAAFAVACHQREPDIVKSIRDSVSDLEWVVARICCLNADRPDNLQLIYPSPGTKVENFDLACALACGAFKCAHWIAETFECRVNLANIQRLMAEKPTITPEGILHVVANWAENKTQSQKISGIHQVVWTAEKKFHRPDIGEAIRKAWGISDLRFPRPVPRFIPKLPKPRA